MTRARSDRGLAADFLRGHRADFRRISTRGVGELLVRGVLSGMVCLGISGCGSAGDAPSLLLGMGTSGTSAGDWDDVDNAVAVAAGKCQMAVVEIRGVGEDEREYDLLTVTDEPARVRAQRTAGLSPSSGSAASSEQFQVRAHVGRFGDVAVEQSLIDHIKVRLRDLAGVDFAPVR